MTSEPTVFVVDDDSGALKSMQWLLESDGLPAETFSSAAEFLERYDPSRPGCLLFDLQMPEIDGLELQQRIESLGSHSPIIFVSAHGDVRRCAEAMKAGAVDFLEKPTDDEELLQLVRQAIERDRQRRCVEASHPEISGRINLLTAREREIMQFLLDGETMKVIAGRLGITIQTVAKHRTRVLDKMLVRNEAELVRLLADYESRE